MSRNLIEAGFGVIGYDVATEAVAAFREMGGVAAGSAAEVGRSAAIIISSLPSVAALDAVVAELADTPSASRVLAETSTFPVADKERARDALAPVGITVLDCPLSGSGSQARTRDVLVYGSGSWEAYERALPVFEGFSRAPHYLGEFGAGSKTKFVANLLVAVHTAAAGEAFALARKAGLDPAKTFEVVVDGAGGSSALRTRGSMLIADTYLPIATMPLNLWRKDMRVISEFANALACPTPMFSAAIPLFNAAVASGLGDQDTAAVCAVIEAMAGLPRPPSGEQPGADRAA